MTDLIVRLFIKDSKNVSNPAVRARYGIVSSVVGIILNILLAGAKFVFGILSNSIAVTADAINNLSDSATSAVTLVGFKLASKPADREHPFGHGRIEYVCALVIAFLVLLAGFETGKSSVLKIISGEEAIFSWVVVVGLFVSVLAKGWLCLFNRKLGKRISSSAMEAVAADSISDALSTAVTLLAIVLSRFTTFPIDGYVGILVCIIIFRAGVEILKKTLTPLLGTAPSKELVKKLRAEIIAYDKILGIHDLVVHEYGPGRLFASLHAEVSASEDILSSHALIDRIENEVSAKFGIEVLIHMDPLEIESEESLRIRDSVHSEILKLDTDFSVHDFRIVQNGRHKNILFDVNIPIDYAAPNEIVRDMIISAVGAIDSSFVVKPKIDRNVI